MLLFGQKCETFAADLIGLVVVGMEYTYVYVGTFISRKGNIFSSSLACCGTR